MRLRIAVALGAILCAAWSITYGAETSSGPALHIGSFNWNAHREGFGGLSAIEVDPKGIGFYTLSDRGHIFHAEFERDGDRISAIRNISGHALPDDQGNVPGRFNVDTEGLAETPDGRLYVSFEGFARIWWYVGTENPARWVRLTPGFRNYESNGSLEALAVDDRGRIYTTLEEKPEKAPGFPLYRLAPVQWDDQKWERLGYIAPHGDYHPVGADFGPDGWLYLLERDFERLQFRSRVRRFLIRGDKIVAEEPVLQSTLGQHDNLEGISVWKDADGRIRLTMVSDNNFKPFLQRTEIVEYVLP